MYTYIYIYVTVMTDGTLEQQYWSLDWSRTHQSSIFELSIGAWINIWLVCVLYK